jgi:hypothetical protein
MKENNIVVEKSFAFAIRIVIGSIIKTVKNSQKIPNS